jgi:hypothetical protein
MILDKYLSFDTKVYISLIFSGLWIYFRTEQCYEMIPSHKMFPVIFVMGWTYLNYYEPLFLPIGLAILAVYPLLKKLINVA